MRRRLGRWWRRASPAQTDAGLRLQPPPNGPVVFDPSLQTAAELTMAPAPTEAGIPPPPKAA
jgi:hypothetical protein